MGLFSGLAKVALSPIKGIAEIADDITNKNGEVEGAMSILTLGASSVIKGTAKGIKKGAEKHTASWYRQECSKQAKLIARLLAGYKCEYCGLGEEQGKQTHGSHVHCENAHHSLSADLQNIICLCSGHHVGMGNVTPNWHKDPRLMMKWFEAKFPDRVIYLNEKLKTPQHNGLFEWKNRLAELKEQYFKLIN